MKKLFYIFLLVSGLFSESFSALNLDEEQGWKIPLPAAEHFSDSQDLGKIVSKGTKNLPCDHDLSNFIRYSEDTDTIFLFLTESDLKTGVGVFCEEHLVGKTEEKTIEGYPVHREAHNTYSFDFERKADPFYGKTYWSGKHSYGTITIASDFPKGWLSNAIMVKHTRPLNGDCSVS